MSCGLGRRAAIAFALLDMGVASLSALAVFSGLPVRYWPVDLAAAAVIALFALAGLGLLTGRRWGLRLAQAASLVALVAGVALITLVALAVSYLSAIYGPVGRGGALIELLCAALAFPYLVVFPAVQLAWSVWARQER